MLGSSSSQSLNELMQRSTPESMVLRDTLSRNVSNVSLTEMVRNYSSGSLEAVMEQGEGWPDQADPATYPSHSEAHAYGAQAPATVSPKVRLSSCADVHVCVCPCPQLLRSVLSSLLAYELPLLPQAAVLSCSLPQWAVLPHSVAAESARPAGDRREERQSTTSCRC